MPVRHWRLWVVGAVLPLAVLAGLVVAFVPTDVIAAPPLPSVATQTTCVDRGGRPRTVSELNDQIAHLQGTPAFQGADVGADAALGDGRFLVVFGDTLRGEDFDGPLFARNSMLLWDTDCVSVVLPPSQGALIPDREDGVGYWPMSTAVAHRPGYDLVLVSAQRVRATGAGSFDFANLGTSLAVFVVAEGGTPQLISVKDIGPDDPRRSRPEWGAAMAVDDNWLYLFGTANPDEEGVFGFSLKVARVRPDHVLDASTWRFWDGSTWQRDAGESAQLVAAVDGVSQTLSVFHRGDRWYALSKRDGDLGDQMAFWTAPRATGPFTPTAPVADLPADPTPARSPTCRSRTRRSSRRRGPWWRRTATTTPTPRRSRTIRRSTVRRSCGFRCRGDGGARPRPRCAAGSCRASPAATRRPRRTAR